MNSEIITFVQDLFDRNATYNQDLDNWDAVAFSKQIFKEYKRRKFREKLVLSGQSDTDLTSAVLEKLGQARLKLSGLAFDEIWSSIELTLDYGVMGSDFWAPKVLPNGALLIRNHHRVIGMVEQTYGSINLRNAALRKEMLKLIEHMTQLDEQEDETFGFSIIHRSDEGFNWSKSLPDQLSETGQSILILPISWAEAAQKLNLKGLGNPNTLFAATQSRSGHCLIRVFKDVSYIYTTARMSDEYDTILEEFSNWLGEEPDEEENLTFTPHADSESIKAEILETLKSQYTDDIDKSKLDLVLSLLVKNAIEVDYVARKCRQIQDFAPIFGERWDIPTTYWGSSPAFWQQNINAKNKLIAIEIDYGFVKGFASLSKALFQKIENAFGTNELIGARIYLPINSRNKDQRNSDIFIWGSNEAQERLAEIVKELRSQFKSETAGQSLTKSEKSCLEQEFLENCSLSIAVLILRESSPVPEDEQKSALLISKKISASVRLHIPSIGFSQSYWDGEVDSGNCGMYLTEDCSDRSSTI